MFLCILLVIFDLHFVETGMIKTNDAVIFSVSASATTKALANTLAGWGFNKSYQLEINYPTEDNIFWPRYFGMGYAPGIPLPLHKRFIARLIYLVGKLLSKRIIITYKK